MIGLVIVAHGGLADQYLAALEHVVGPVPNAVAIAVGADEPRAEARIRIEAAIDSVEGPEGVVIVTDLFGGTPSNLSMAAATTPNRRVLYGANLPLLIKLSKLRQKSLDELVEESISAARKYINCADGANGPNRRG